MGRRGPAPFDVAACAQPQSPHGRLDSLFMCVR